MALGVERGSSAGGLGLLAAAALLAGCAADADPQPRPEPMPTTTAPSASPTAAERPEVEKPTPPEAMRRDDVAGAEAAAQYFLQLYPYVYATGDLTDWKAMSHPECGFCRSVETDVTDIDQWWRLRNRRRTPQVSEIKGREPLSGNPYFRVDIRASQEPTTVIHLDGGSEKSSGGKNTLIFALGNDEGHWTVREVQVEDAEFGG